MVPRSPAIDAAGGPAGPTPVGGGPALLMVSTVAASLHFVVPFADHFRDLGWRVEAAAGGATAVAAFDEHFDALHELPLSRSIRDVRGVVRGLRAIAGLVAGGYAVIHVHTPIAAFLVRAAVRRLPVATRPAVVYTAHGFHFHPHGRPVENAVFILAEQVAGRWTDHLVVINAWDHEAARRHRIVPARRLSLMPGIGVDTRWYDRALVPDSDVDAVRADLGIGPATPLFTVVGSLDRRKRPTDVVAALARMRRPDAHLLLLGDGPARDRVLAVAREAGVGARVHLAGMRADVRPAVVAAAALVLASSREGLPRSIMEALSLEVPVVTTDARGNPDTVLPDAGLVVPIGDVDDLAAAMDRILDDPAAAREMGRRGRARMIAEYDVAILLARHEALYGALLAERSRRMAGASSGPADPLSRPARRR